MLTLVNASLTYGSSPLKRFAASVKYQLKQNVYRWDAGRYREIGFILAHMSGFCVSLSKEFAVFVTLSSNPHIHLRFFFFSALSSRCLHECAKGAGSQGAWQVNEAKQKEQPSCTAGNHVANFKCSHIQKKVISAKWDGKNIQTISVVHTYIYIYEWKKYNWICKKSLQLNIYTWI